MYLPRLSSLLCVPDCRPGPENREIICVGTAALFSKGEQDQRNMKSLLQHTDALIKILKPRQPLDFIIGYL